MRQMCRILSQVCSLNILSYFTTRFKVPNHGCLPLYEGIFYLFRHNDRCTPGNMHENAQKMPDLLYDLYI